MNTVKRMIFGWITIISALLFFGFFFEYLMTIIDRTFSTEVFVLPTSIILLVISVVSFKFYKKYKNLDTKDNELTKELAPHPKKRLHFISKIALILFWVFCLFVYFQNYSSYHLHNHFIGFFLPMIVTLVWFAFYFSFGFLKWRRNGEKDEIIDAILMLVLIGSITFIRVYFTCHFFDIYIYGVEHQFIVNDVTLCFDIL